MPKHRIIINSLFMYRMREREIMIEEITLKEGSLAPDDDYN